MLEKKKIIKKSKFKDRPGKLNQIGSDFFSKTKRKGAAAGPGCPQLPATHTRPPVASPGWPAPPQCSPNQPILPFHPQIVILNTPGATTGGTRHLSGRISGFFRRSFAERPPGEGPGWGGANTGTGGEEELELPRSWAQRGRGGGAEPQPPPLPTTIPPPPPVERDPPAGGAPGAAAAPGDGSPRSLR